MKIVPVSDILIEGKHSPAGVACETSELIGKALVAQGLAKLATVKAGAAAETAQAAPEVETASATPAKKTAAKAKA